MTKWLHSTQLCFIQMLECSSIIFIFPPHGIRSVLSSRILSLYSSPFLLCLFSVFSDQLIHSPWLNDYLTSFPGTWFSYILEIFFKRKQLKKQKEGSDKLALLDNIWVSTDFKIKCTVVKFCDNIIIIDRATLVFTKAQDDSEKWALSVLYSPTEFAEYAAPEESHTLAGAASRASEASTSLKHIWSEFPCASDAANIDENL